MLYPQDREECEELPKVRSGGSSQSGREFRREIAGLTKDEADKLQRALMGLSWVRVVDGRLQEHSTVHPLPGPADDESMLPFWRPHNPREPNTQLVLKMDTQMERLSEHSMPSIFIQSLCGYHYTPKGYESQAKQLESFGFECLRSRRGSNGNFWEIWYLPGLWAAKGELKLFIERDLEEKISRKSMTMEARMDQILLFIFRQCPFGSAHVSVQKLAMAIDD